MENLDPLPPPPQIKDGKMARFGFCAASSLIWGGGGGGWGFAVPFYFVRDCSYNARDLKKRNRKEILAEVVTLS